MSVAQSIRSATVWVLAGQTGTRVLQFAFGILIARLLAPEDFGLLVTAGIFTGVAGIVAGGGLGQALIRSKEATEQDFYVVFTMQLAVGVALYVLFFFTSPLIAAFFDEPFYTDLLRITALYFVSRPLLSIHSSWLHREMRFKERSIVGLQATIVGSIVTLLLALAGMKVWSLVLSGFFGTFLTWFLLSRVTGLKPRLTLDRATVRKVSAYGMKVSANDLVSYARAQISNFIISMQLGPAAVGLFNRGEGLGKMPFSTISGAVYQPVLREMSKVQDQPEQIKYLFFKMIGLLVIYTLPFYIGVVWLAHPFITVVYGAKWAPAAEILQILALPGLIFCIGHPCGAVLAATNRLGRELLVQGSTVAIVAVGCYFGLPRFGLAGAAWALVLGYAYSTLLMYLLAVKAFRHEAADLARALAPGLMLNGLLLAVLLALELSLPSTLREQHPALYLLILGGGGACAYLGAFLFLPYAGLRTESARWRAVLRLSR